MPKSTTLVLLALLCGTLAACSAVQPGGGINPDAMDDINLLTTDVAAARAMAPQGSTFTQSLRAGYFDLAGMIGVNDQRSLHGELVQVGCIDTT